ncbi:Cell division protein FtsQ [Candidatus Methylocalor cossyra]|uniref:Cell division protein FtsQ n=1 Tax=Candidatus Methylocalor cossyra TaxID=3108543 RepID=A0ABM9NI09_9GAMM
MQHIGRRRQRVTRKRALRALATAAVLCVLVWRLDPTDLRAPLPVSYVRITGPVWNLNADELRQVLAPVVSKSYLAVDLDEVEAAARRLPWIDEVRVARVWPDTLVLSVKEQRPVARWGEDSLVNIRGERFTPASLAGFEYLPRLSGPPGQEKAMLATLRALDARLKARQLRVEALSLSPRRAWTAELTGGLEIVFGNQDPLAALDRLLALLPRLGEERIAAIRKLDLRYPNGFSVIWKPEAQSFPELSTGGALPRTTARA